MHRTVNARGVPALRSDDHTIVPAAEPVEHHLSCRCLVDEIEAPSAVTKIAREVLQLRGSHGTHHSPQVDALEPIDETHNRLRWGSSLKRGVRVVEYWHEL